MEHKQRNPRPTPLEHNQIPNRDGSLPFPKQKKTNNSSTTKTETTSTSNDLNSKSPSKDASQ